MKFEEIVKDDFEQYREVARKFRDVKLEDIDTLIELTKTTWLLATRWSEIQAQAVQISSQYEINKTDFSNWAYQKYRNLQELHITCRSWLRLSIEEKRAVERGGINDM